MGMSRPSKKDREWYKKFRSIFLNEQITQQLVDEYYEEFPQLSKDHIYYLVEEIMCILVREFGTSDMGSTEWQRYNSYQAFTKALTSYLSDEEFNSASGNVRLIYCYSQREPDADFLKWRLSDAVGPARTRLEPVPNPEDYVQLSAQIVKDQAPLILAYVYNSLSNAVKYASDEHKTPEVETDALRTPRVSWAERVGEENRNSRLAQ